MSIGPRRKITIITSPAPWRAVVVVAMALLGVAISVRVDAADLAAAKQSERRVLGQSLDGTLAANAGPALRKTLEQLRGKAQTQGKVRVIISVRAAFAPEGNLPDVERQIQREDIAAVQRRIHARLPRQEANAVTHFEFVPFSALAVDPDELDTLAAMLDVTDIQEDRLSKPTLAQSVPLIRGTAAWAAGYTGSGWTVAVLDTGVDKTHAFLSGKVVSEACYSTTNSLSGAKSVCPGGVSASTATGSAVNCSLSIEGCDHGTHVAGIAAGLGSAFSGVARGANIIAIQVFSRFDSVSECGGSTPCALSYDSDRIKALNQVYALRNTYNIAAINISIGGGRYYTQSACDAASGSEKATIDLLRSVGIATVISSGNDGYLDSASAPGCISSAVIVGATFDAAGYTNSCDGWNGGTSSVDEVACFSNSATFLDLLAPGADIVSSVPGGGFASKWGTSMAAPHVVGCWAILKEARPTATADQIEQALKNTAVPVQDWRNSAVKPRIDCKAALDSLLGVSSSAPNLTISAFSVSPITVGPGGTVTLAATVRNAGFASSGATTLRYYESNGSTSNELTSCRKSIGSLAAGATSNQSCAIIAPSSATTKVFYAAVDLVSGETITSDNTSAPATLTVTAAPIPSVMLTVSRSGAGGGTVTGAGINCGIDCTELYPSGSSVSLTATPSAGTTFTGWSGACTGGTCQILMSGAKSVTANFALTPSNLTISDFAASPAVLNAGGTVMLTATVRNAGAGTSSGTTLRYYSWTGIAWSEITLCRDSIGSLAQGATSNQSCAIVPPSNPGTFYYYVAVDAVSGETVTTDNDADYITVVTLADISVPVSNMITRYYQTILGRAPDGGGFTFYQGEVTRMRGLGADVSEVFYAMALQFFNSAEYTSRNRGDTQFLTDLYQTFFVRAPDPGGLAFWQGQLASGVPRLTVLNSFMFSAEFGAFMTNAFGTATASRAEVSAVLDYYRGLLGRLPDTGGFNFWLAQFRAAQCQGAAAVGTQADLISQQFVASGEYVTREVGRPAPSRTGLYVSDLYNAFLKRQVDLSGFQFWVNQIASNALTREQVRKGFIGSPEFQGKLAAIVAQGCLQ